MNISGISEDFLEGRVELDEIVPIVEKDVYQKTAERLTEDLLQHTSFPPIAFSYYNLDLSKYTFVLRGSNVRWHLDKLDLWEVTGGYYFEDDENIPIVQINELFYRIYDETLPF